MSIILTEKASSELKAIITREIQEKRLGAQAGLRVIVQGGGCSGFTYRMGFDENQQADDTVVENNGIKVLIDPRSILYLKGTEIDFQEGPMGRGFVFQNPNAQASGCDCGSGGSCH